MGALDWHTDGLAWPHRGLSRFIDAGRLRWHVQHWPHELAQREGQPESAPVEPKSTWPTALPQNGTRPHWVLLHGTGASLHSWYALAPVLQAHANLWLVDLPGHAFTRGAGLDDLSLAGMSAALHRLLGELRVEPDAIVGHSAGAAIALQMAASGRLPPHTRIVSLDGALMPWSGVAGTLFLPLARLMAATQLAARLFAARAQQPGVVDELIAQTGSRVPEASLRCYRTLATNAHHVHGVLNMMARWRLEELVPRLPAVRHPVALITHARDGTVPPRVSDEAAARLPHATRLALPRGGHLDHEESPAIAGETVVAWLASAAAGAVCDAPQS